MSADDVEGVLVIGLLISLAFVIWFFIVMYQIHAAIREANERLGKMLAGWQRWRPDCFTSNGKAEER